MQVKVVHFDHETSKFYAVAIVNVPSYQLGFNKAEMDACEYAFARTQNIFGSWSKGQYHEDGEENQDYSTNVDVLLPLPIHEGRTYGFRSSMIGDLFVVNGNIYVCKTFGFELYEKEFA